MQAQGLNKETAISRTLMVVWRRRLTAVVFVGSLAATGWSQGTVSLPAVTVYSPRVANQSSAIAFAMPVSALRYEPRVDIQGRNLAEGQADVTIRGGTFENSGFQLGGLTMNDPQTGHYLTEFPVAPAMLGAPMVLTGSDLLLGAANATVGAVAYRWRPMATAGAAVISVGEDRLRRGEIFQGITSGDAAGGARYGLEVALAHSASDGAVSFGDHEFDRANLRLQRRRGGVQTDVFAGYQAKQFGWPNLYTPFNSNEAENLQTTLLVFNHRAESGPDEQVEFGVFHRRNKDDYAFNRFAPVGAVHPFQHTTWVSGGALEARHPWAGLVFDLRAEVLADELESTSLTAGKYRSRTLAKVAFAGERRWSAEPGAAWRARTGIAYDDTNRTAGSLSPVAELAREFTGGKISKVGVSYARTTQVATYTALNSSATAGLFRGNPNLPRTVSHNLELGLAGQLEGWKTEGALFFRQDRSLVDWTFRRGVTARTANPVDVDVAGVEIGARRSWAGGELQLGYTGLTKQADYRGAAVDASFYALNYARHRLTAAITARLGREVEVRLDNAARWQAANLLRVQGGNHALTSAVGICYRPTAWRGVELTLRVDNLWDDSFQEVPAVPASPRQTSVALGYAW